MSATGEGNPQGEEGQKRDEQGERNDPLASETIVERGDDGGEKGRAGDE